MQYKNLSLIGTSHIAKQSINEVKQAITQGNPDIVAVELDRTRLSAIMENKKRKVSLLAIRRIGIKGMIFALIGAWAQKKLGKMVGVEPGSEMITAIKLTKKLNKKLALIDQDIEYTLHRFSQTLSWKEKFRFPLDILKAVIFRKSELKRLGVENLDLTKVPPKEIVQKLTREMRQRYPNVYKVLVQERNQYMAEKIRILMRDNPKSSILAIVGAGHEEELLGMIKKGTEKAKQDIEPPEIRYEYTVSAGI